MKKIIEHIEYVKGKPHHVRKQIAFGAATLMSALIAFVWLAGNYASGTFVLRGSSFADATGQGNTVQVMNSGVDSQNLAGVGAASAFESSQDAPAHIEIVDTTPTAKKQPEQTILPF
ncbi:MAG: hypothetical protein WC790_00760 [Candidatus Paceibacterota bacterium]|jgi:hypothetical protein